MTAIDHTLYVKDFTQFRVPAVRHLAWMCQAPQLLKGDGVFHPAVCLPADTFAVLRRWDEEPEAGPALLTDVPHPRLGLYFEQLYACLLTELLGWDILARNLPIRAGGRTLGELDFVVRNGETGSIEHHEIAVKFYLGYCESNAGRVMWYGPNARDRLDIKTRRLLEEQGPRSQLVEAGAALQAKGIAPPSVSRVFMPGYLFYPSCFALTPPAQVSVDHGRGHWLCQDAIRKMDTDQWVILRKPHWLGPWCQLEKPDQITRQRIMEELETMNSPRLCARLEQDGGSDLWKEVERFFVVPASWPNAKEGNTG